MSSFLIPAVRRAELVQGLVPTPRTSLCANFPAISHGLRPAGKQVVRSTKILAVILGLAAMTIPLARAQTGLNDNVGPEATAELHIDKATLNTKIAATPAQEERGLMYVTHLPDNDGMIFVLPLGHAEFWMKNTLIPLSVAFIDKNGVILEIHDMQPGDPAVPDDQLPRTRSDSDQVQYALETNLHWFSLNSIKPGDKLDPPPATLVKPADVH